MIMQIGEKVRFLNEVGGGIISGFQGKDIVLVEDEDGFDIPMLRSQVVVVETNANNFVRKSKPQKPMVAAEVSKPFKAAATPSVERQSLKAAVNAGLDADEEDTDPSERPITFQPKPKERKGGELLNVCLAFVPEDSRELSSTRFEAYLINDSNYFVSIVLSNNEGAAWHLRWQGTMEPNTKQHVETFDRSILNDLQRLSIQLNDMVAHTIKEIAVVCHHQQRHFAASQVIFQPFHHIEIEMIGRLIQNKQFGIIDEGIHQCHTFQLSSRQL
jgi:hypothetical protein